MIKSEGNLLFIDGKQYTFSYPIEKVEEFENVIVIMFDSDCEERNNVVGIDYNGKTLWNINDILHIQNPPGMTAIKKLNESYLGILSSVGVQYTLDIKSPTVIGKEYMRF